MPDEAGIMRRGDDLTPPPVPHYVSLGEISHLRPRTYGFTSKGPGGQLARIPKSENRPSNAVAMSETWSGVYTTELIIADHWGEWPSLSLSVILNL